MTTTALALAAAGALPPAAAAGRPVPTTAVAPVGRPLLVELDPAGGDLDCWCGPLGEPGLLGAVTDLHDRTSSGRLARHAVEVAPGVDAVVAPTTGASVTAALRSAAGSFADAVAAAASTGTVIVDLGRWTPVMGIHVDRLARAAASVAVVCRPALASVEHARALVTALQATTRRVVVVIVGGDRPYSAGEVSAAVGAPVAGVLPWDPRAVATLVDQGASRAWARSALAAAATDLAASLGQISAPERGSAADA